MDQRLPFQMRGKSQMTHTTDDRLAAVEAERALRFVLDEADAAGPQMNGVGLAAQHGSGQRAMEIGAMEGEVGRVVPNAATLMIAERGADIILSEYYVQEWAASCAAWFVSLPEF